MTNIQLESLSKRLRSKINEAENGCWVWTAFKASCYPIIRDKNKSKDARHFVRKELKCEEVDRLVALCGDVYCCNPFHQISFNSLEAELIEFEDRLIINGPDECWGWSGVMRPATGKNGSDRPRFLDRQGKVHYAYRWFCRNFLGLKDEQVVMHLCDNSMCMNPKHWKIGTQQENVDDMLSKWRHMHGKEHIHSPFEEKDIIEIRELRKRTGMSYAKIADRFGVTVSSIFHICKRKYWSHVE